MKYTKANLDAIITAYFDMKQVQDYDQLPIDQYVDMQEVEEDTFYYLAKEDTPCVLFEVVRNKPYTPQLTGYVRIYESEDVYEDDYEILSIADIQDRIDCCDFEIDEDCALDSQLTDEQQKLFVRLENHDFSVRFYIGRERKIAAEVETYTEGGVNMIFDMDPFDIGQLRDYYEEFDMDEEIDLHREDKRYREAFRISQSVKDFHAYEVKLYELITDFEKATGYNSQILPPESYE